MSGAHLGGKQSSSSETTETITNTDKRIANQGGLVMQDIGENFGGTINYNSPDAVVAMTNMGLGVIEGAGAAVVDLTSYAIDRNLDTVDYTTKQTTALIDKISQDSFAFQQSVQQQANSAIQYANQQAASQVKAANDSATRVTADTLEGARALIDRQQTTVAAMSKQNADLGSALSQAAIAAYTPGDSKSLDVVKWIGIAAVVAVAAAVVFNKKG